MALIKQYTTFGGVAQLVECVPHKDKVTGSIPVPAIMTNRSSRHKRNNNEKQPKKKSKVTRKSRKKKAFQPKRCGEA